MAKAKDTKVKNTDKVDDSVKEKKATKVEKAASASFSLNNFSAFDNSTKKRKRVGRGNASGFGGECGRGHKGQKSRSGFSRKRGFEGGQNPLYKRIPKKRGFYNPFKKQFSIVNIENLNLEQFDSSIEMKHLIDFKLVDPNKAVKFVGSVPENFAIKSIETNAISKSLKDKLEKLGCNIIILN